MSNYKIIGIDKDNPISLDGITLQAFGVSCAVVKNVDDLDEQGKPRLTRTKINMEFPLMNVKLDDILIQALNNRKTDVANDLRKRVNNEFKQTPDESVLFDIHTDMIKNGETLIIKGLLGKYPEIQLTPEQERQIIVKQYKSLDEEERLKLFNELQDIDDAKHGKK